MSQNIKIVLKSGKDQSLLRFHPWVFSGAIKQIEGNPKEGDVVDVVDVNRQLLGRGHYQIGSIAVRILTFNDEVINNSYWESKIQSAVNVRNALGFVDSESTNAFRLIHGEGDGLPGLIVDFYAGTAVLQTHSVGMYLARHEISQALQKILGNRLNAIYEKSEGTLPFKAGLNAENGYLWGKSTNNVALENGLLFNVDWEKGQKTGFFVDQRDNRALVEHYSKNRDVLNMFCYTGGFSFYAMRGGANLVHSVDSSERAVELTKANVDLNFSGDKRHEAFAEDAFKFLDKIKNRYDLIILDPPAFAKHHNVLGNALQGYRRINAKAFEQIRPGGILFTFSCSQVVSKEVFRTTVFSAAAKAGRNVRILNQLTQPADHPVNIYHPEGEYLKGLVLYVE